ncbi:MAG: glycosyltransferase family 2 protein [Patescibacteria group bacterium]|nr:glycosyltransferase family 2 protein [Patescibacteria group bacterium]MDD4610943.1 glycosyltransferase family 2 protein [Patescibacteria group bacterium]
MSHKKLIIGFITYGESTAKYLPYFMRSLDEQTFQDFEILVCDNTEVEENENREYLLKNYTDIDFEWSGENIGFSRGYNKLIRKAVKLGAEYFLALNIDMILEPGAVKKMVEELDSDAGLGSVNAKVYRWDFKNNVKTLFIDACGIALRGGLRFVGIGQGELDKGQYDNAEILGPDGGAVMYRIDALEKIKISPSYVKASECKEGECSQYFDELMFMYKEDCDLAYRLFLAGYKSKCVSDAIIYHDRTAAAAGESNLEVALNRKNKSRRVKEWSFLNQHIIFLKYWRLQNRRNKIAILWYAFKMFVFAIFFERYLLKQYLKLWKIKNKINYHGLQ